MVRVWLRPALAALGRQAARNAAMNAGRKQVQMVQQQTIALRMFSSKKDKSYEKKSLHDKFVDVENDLTEVPPDVEYLVKEEMKLERLRSPIDVDPEFLKAAGDLVDDIDEDEDEDDDDDRDLESLDEDELEQLQELIEGEEDDDDLLDEDDEDDEDEELTDAEWAAKYERELASIESGEGPEDDRLYIEMPNYDSSLSMASENDVDDEDDSSSDPFGDWDQGVAYSPEMLNWMVPQDKRQPFGTKKEKPWKYFVRANHPDPVELAMDVNLLRLFISPTGRIRPRRFTGLTAKQQRQLARAIKISRQMALLPYLSRYPEPSPEQWRAMEEEEIARLEALAENEDDSVDDDDDDDEFEVDDE